MAIIFKGKNSQEAMQKYFKWMEANPEKVAKEMKVSSRSGPGFFAFIVDLGEKGETPVPNL